ncbi:MAG: hypothetical protein G01um101470_504 [Parcubacteria group bacterium Gr01-1014_70]|nr:MAG: hypothetical protein G01um101470_504 [Parcubacteria group bacterium Gr01-1014_70]
MPRYVTFISWVGKRWSESEKVEFTARNARKARRRHRQKLKEFEEQQGNYDPPNSVRDGGLYRIGKHGICVQKLAVKG